MAPSTQDLDRRVRRVRRRVMAAGQLVHERAAHLDEGPQQQVDEASRLVGSAAAESDAVIADASLTEAKALADQAYETAARTYDYTKRRHAFLRWLFGRRQLDDIIYDMQMRA